MQGVLLHITERKDKKKGYFWVVANTNLAQLFVKQKCKNIVNSKNQGEKGVETCFHFSLVGVFYIGFSSFFRLEQSVRKLCFVKYIYQINISHQQYYTISSANKHKDRHSTSGKSQPRSAKKRPPSKCNRHAIAAIQNKISLPVLQQADRLGLRTWPLFPAIAPLGINKTAPQRCYSIVGVQFW